MKKREELITLIEEWNYKKQLKLKKAILEKLIFDDKLCYCKTQDYNNIIKTCKVFSVDKSILEKLDLSEVSFDDFLAENMDFSGLYGVKLNPQKVYSKSLCCSILNGVEIIGPFDDVNVERTNFKGVLGNNKLNPQTVNSKSLYGAVLSGIEIVGSYNNVNVERTNFKGVLGNNKINPQKIYSKSLFCTKLCDMEITGSFDGVDLENTDFRGIIGHNELNPQTVKLKTLHGTILENVNIIGSFEDVDTEEMKIIYSEQKKQNIKR